MEGREQMQPVLPGSGQLQVHERCFLDSTLGDRESATAQTEHSSPGWDPLPTPDSCSRPVNSPWKYHDAPCAHTPSEKSSHRLTRAHGIHVHRGLCVALPCPHSPGDKNQLPDKHFWVLYAIPTSGRDQRRAEPPEGDAQPQAGVLPFHTPPWRGPLGTKGEILHMQTSWLAPGTGERTPVSTSLPGHTTLIPPSRVITAQGPGPGDRRRPAWFRSEILRGFWSMWNPWPSVPTSVAGEWSHRVMVQSK